MAGPGPDPMDPRPMKIAPRVGFLKPLVMAENVEIGEFTYYDDPGARGRLQRAPEAPAKGAVWTLGRMWRAGERALPGCGNTSLAPAFCDRRLSWPASLAGA